MRKRRIWTVDRFYFATGSLIPSPQGILGRFQQRENYILTSMRKRRPRTLDSFLFCNRIRDTLTAGNIRASSAKSVATDLCMKSDKMSSLLVSSWILTSPQPHRITSGRITQSTFFHTRPKHDSLNHKSVQTAITTSKTTHPWVQQHHAYDTSETNSHSILWYLFIFRRHLPRELA